MPPVLPMFSFDNSYARELPGFFSACQPAQVSQPHLVYLNRPLAADLGVDIAASEQDTLAQLFSGKILPEGAEPLAQAYAGHQFGNFSPLLGDGRALLIGEQIDPCGQRRDIAFKGSGQTPYSRRGDGKAALGPMLREVLIGEALHALGIATTRALAVVATGEPVYRERVLPGAVLTRVAASHIRVGTFELFASRGQTEQLRRLADYTIARHYPAVAGSRMPYLGLLQAVAERQAALVAAWMNIGFIHGVMNTDNMALSGESIDFGPCAWMEAYDPATVFSSIDQQGRYAFGNQPHIARWNLARFAEALLTLIDEDEKQAIALASGVINDFPKLYLHHWLAGVRAKLGIGALDDQADFTLAQDWLALLQANQVDFTLAWRRLAEAAEGDDRRLRSLFADHAALLAWLSRWQARCALEDAGVAGAGAERAAAMRRVNPWLIARNHRVEEALQAASEQGDMAPFERLLSALGQPYEEDPAHADLAEPAPKAVTACYRTFCGT